MSRRLIPRLPRSAERITITQQAVYAANVLNGSRSPQRGSPASTVPVKKRSLSLAQLTVNVDNVSNM